MMRLCFLLFVLTFIVSCFAAKAPKVVPTPPPLTEATVQAPDEIHYYTIPLNVPADIIICVELPSYSFGHVNVSGGAACGFTVGQLRELMIRQKRS